MATLLNPVQDHFHVAPGNRVHAVMLRVHTTLMTAMLPHVWHAHGSHVVPDVLFAACVSRYRLL